MKKLDTKLLYFIAFTMLGMSIVFQYNSIKRNTTHFDYAQVAANLDAQLTAEKLQSEHLKKQIALLEASEEKFLNANIEKENEVLLAQWKQARFLSGLEGVKGRGIRLKVYDKPVRGENPNFNIVHDEDILRLLNEIKNAGAQAISINGERIVSFSEVVCTGPTVQINRNRYPAPFIVEAIGNTDALYRSLLDSSVFVELGQFIGLDLQKQETIFISAFTGDIKRYITGLEVVFK